MPPGIGQRAHAEYTGPTGVDDRPAHGDRTAADESGRVGARTVDAPRDPPLRRRVGDGVLSCQQEMQPAHLQAIRQVDPKCWHRKVTLEVLDGGNLQRHRLTGLIAAPGECFIQIGTTHLWRPERLLDLMGAAGLDPVAELRFPTLRPADRPQVLIAARRPR